VPFVDALQHGQSAQYLAVSVDDFKELLSRIALKFESKKALADALDMDPSRLSRAINTGDFPFNVENCLRLARVSGESPSELLRAADKGDIAELIESLYGPEKAMTDPTVVELLSKWELLTNDERAFMRVGAEALLLARLRWPESTRANLPLTLRVAERQSTKRPQEPIEGSYARGAKAAPVKHVDVERVEPPRRQTAARKAAYQRRKLRRAIQLDKERRARNRNELTTDATELPQKKARAG
jgi:hypothetical protein